jgi:hypothetical protein
MDVLQLPKADADNMEFETFDQYVNAKFVMNDNGEPVIARVTKRAWDNEGNPIGQRNANPLLDTCEYECTMDDGTVYWYNANVIVENIFLQCNNKGRQHAVLKEIIIDHQKE